MLMSLEKREITVANFTSPFSTLVFPTPRLEQKENGLLHGWSAYVNPQGWIYFFNSSLKAVTDQDIRDPEIWAQFNQNMSNSPLPTLDADMEVQLFVQLMTGQEGTTNLFLIINHNQCVASYDLEKLRDKNVHLLSPHQLNRRRRLYWNYLWNHPAHVPTPDRALSDASDALTWFLTDNLISGSKSLAPFSKSECEDLTKVVHQISEPYNRGSVAKTVFLAWLLREVCSFRDAEHFGEYTQKTASAIRQKAVSPKSSSRRPSPLTLLLINLVITCLCFGIPHTYYVHVKSASEYRGRLASVRVNYETYIEKLVREYSHFLLISTVLLGATVGFLSINDINEIAKVGTIVSAFAALGSIIVGVFSMWRHQTYTRTLDSFTYMYNVQHSYFGLHGHAILLSLPPVLLVWAILAFTGSIVAYAMQGVPGEQSASAWIIVGIFVFLLGAVIAALYTFCSIWKLQRRPQRFFDWWRALWIRRRLHSGESEAHSMV